MLSRMNSLILSSSLRRSMSLWAPTLSLSSYACTTERLLGTRGIFSEPCYDMRKLSHVAANMQVLIGDSRTFAPLIARSERWTSQKQ